MIVDCHTHIWIGSGGADALVRGMDANGVDVALVMALDPGDPAVGAAPTDWVVIEAKKFPDRLRAFACVNPLRSKAPSQLHHYVEDMGCVGLKLHPPLQQFSLRNPAIIPTLWTASELGIPVLIHTGPIFVRDARLRYGDARDIDDLALECPETTFIIAHGDPLGVAATLVGKHPNVYMDTSIVFARLAKLIPGLGQNTLEWIARWTPRNKLLFGSDASPPRIYRIKETLDAIHTSFMEDSDRTAVLGATISELVKLR